MTTKPLIAAIAFLHGCAYDWTRTRGVDETVIAWHQSENFGEVCARHLPGQTVRGCAVWMPGRCDIYTPPNPSLELLGHEAKHCFGYSHK